MKIGIVTHYYESKNFGGNLQAFALCDYLNKQGHDAEQISYKFINVTHSYAEKIAKLKIASLSVKQKMIINYIKKRLNINNHSKTIDTQTKNADDFAINRIMHSKKIYTENNIKECIDNYDAFITGSDQVWNPDGYFPAFYLTFAPSNKIKMSYAASLGKNYISRYQLKIFKKNLKDFKAVSVREEDAISLLQPVSPVPVICALDPTLLLNKEDWDAICSPRLIEEEYLFCYILGDSVKQRNLAMQYAKRHNLKLVNIPYLLHFYRKCDDNFGDIMLHDVGPEQFLSLIKYAKFVFTDSFHATIFSGIFERQYISFHREERKGMGSRIYTLTNLFETQERFCDCEEKETINYIESLSDIDYNRKLDKLQQKREESARFLLDNLR